MERTDVYQYVTSQEINRNYDKNFYWIHSKIHVPVWGSLNNSEKCWINP